MTFIDSKPANWDEKLEPKPTPKKPTKSKSEKKVEKLNKATKDVEEAVDEIKRGKAE